MLNIPSKKRTLGLMVGITNLVIAGTLIAAEYDIIELTGYAGDSTVNLSWEDPEADSSFQIYQDTDSDPSGRVRITTVSPETLSYTVEGLDNGTTYYYWVKFTQTDGTTVNSNAFSATPSANTVTLDGSIGDGEITLSWNSSNTDSTYQVYQDTDSDPSGRVRIGQVGSDTTTFTVTGLDNGTTYYFWVKYQNSDGTYSNSSVFSGTPQQGSSGGNDSDSSSSTAAPTAAAAKKAGANSEPLTNGYPSFIKSVDSSATVVSSASALLSAIDDASAGDVIYIRKGTYELDETVSISQSGTSSKAIVLSAYPGDDRPVLDFSDMSENSSNRGFDLKGDYWHFYGFDIRKAGDNGMYLRGSHNTIEFMAFYDNADTGLQLDKGASYNFVKNSDSYYNADSSLENADGFAAKLGVGTGNYFYGCRAWQNLDDGFDGYLRDNDNDITTTWEYSWMIRNGYQKDGSEGVGDGNGFKTGGSDDKDLAHNGIYINTISAGNTHDGYDQNSNRGEITIYNAIAYDNDRNYGMGDGSDRILKKLTIKNSISLDSDSSDKFDASSESISNNTWNGNSASSSDFVSLDMNELLDERQDDGSLPVVKFFHLEDDSNLIDAGTDVGLDYNGSAPDIGSFEK